MFGIANGAGDTDEGVDTRACSLNEEYDNAGREAADHDTQEEAGERAVLGSNGEGSGADTAGHRGGEEGAAFGDVIAIGNAGDDENPHTKKDSEHRTVNRLLNSEKVNWLDLPDGTLIYLFDAIYVREGGRQSIENVSKVCRLWREAALEVVMRDTAGSKMKQPRYPKDSGTKTSCAIIANNEPSSAGLLDDLSSKPRQVPDANEELPPEDKVLEGGDVGGVERLGAKRRRTDPASRDRRAAVPFDDDVDEPAPSNGPANRARDAAQGAVACDDDDDDDEVTATFRGGGDHGDAPAGGQGLKSGDMPATETFRQATRQFLDGPQPGGTDIMAQIFRGGRGRDADGAGTVAGANDAERREIGGAQDFADGIDRAAARREMNAATAAFGDAETTANSEGAQMTTGQIRGIQERTYDLLFNFWSRRDPVHANTRASDAEDPRPVEAAVRRGNGGRNGEGLDAEDPMRDAGK